MIYFLSKDVEYISLDDEGSVIFDSKTGDTHVINSIGKEILELCNGINTVNNIISSLSNIYDISSEDIFSDVKEFLTQLFEKGVLIAKEP